MSLNKSLIIGGMALAALVLLAPSCDTATVPIIPVCGDGVDCPEGEVLPLPAAVFLSADRPRLIRDDANEGSAVLTATASQLSAFTWTVDTADGLVLDVRLCGSARDDCEECGVLPSDGVDLNVGEEAYLKICGILSDPGPTGAEVRVTVAAMPVDGGGEPAEETVVLSVVRPASELAVSVSADSARMEPLATVDLMAIVSGGAPFLQEPGGGAGNCDAATEENKYDPPDLEPPYCITWTIDESGLLVNGRPGGTLTLEGLRTGDNGETLSDVTYSSPLAVGSVTFRVDVSDRRGNKATATLAVSVQSSGQLNVEVFSTSPAVQPSSSTEITAEVSGGTPPYIVCFAFRDQGQGSLPPEDSDCLPDPEDPFFEGSTLCTCDVGDLGTHGLVAETVAREYVASGESGSDTIVVRVKDATGAEASSALSINITSSAGSSGTGGTGTVSIIAQPARSALCAGEQTTITATTQGGSPPFTFTFEVQGGALLGESIDPAGSGPVSVRTYQAPTNPIGPRNITVTVEESGGGPPASTNVVITSEDLNCDDGNECTQDVCALGQCAYPPEPAGVACGSPTDNACTDPDTCNGAGVCAPNHAANGTLCNDGLFCNENETCSGGACGGGNAHDCSDAFTCTVDACDENADQCDNSALVAGTCLIDNVCYNSGDENPANECEECNPANNLFVWSNKGAGAPCGDQQNTLCTDPDSCDGAGMCLDRHAADGTACQTDGDDCTDDVCGAGACTHPNSAAGTPCGDQGTSDCDTANTCDGAGTCENNPVADGTPCTNDGLECTDDVCGGGLCTHPNLAAGTACGDPTATQCDSPDTCDGAGGCLDNYVSAGTACGDPTQDDCTNPDTCDGAGACLDNHQADGTACISDGNECTGDECSAGVCTHPNLVPGMPCGDPSNTVCTDPDTCNGFGACLANDAADGTICPDDANECTDDVCGGGVCTHPNLAAGTPCGDQGGGDCDSADTCDGAGTCEANPAQDGDPCTEDGNDCTDDVCSGGVCTHPNFSAGTACGDPTDTECDDPDTCDGAGGCLDNYVPAGIACGDPTDTDCNHADTCDGAGSCLDNIQPEGAACGDPGDTVCDNPDTCDNFGNCDPRHEPNGINCGPQNTGECDVADECDGNGVCLMYEPPGTACGDSTDDDCTDPDTCDGAGTCLDNDELDGFACTDDGNDCTDDVCSSGACDHPDLADGTACTDDGNDCTDDVCSSGVCDHPDFAAGAPCGDSSDTDCTDPDTCDGAGVCDPNHAADGTVCTDCDNPPCDVCLDGVCLDL